MKTNVKLAIFHFRGNTQFSVFFLKMPCTWTHWYQALDPRQGALGTNECTEPKRHLPASLNFNFVLFHFLMKRVLFHRKYLGISTRMATSGLEFLEL